MNGCPALQPPGPACRTGANRPRHTVRQCRPWSRGRATAATEPKPVVSIACGKQAKSLPDHRRQKKTPNEQREKDCAPCKQKSGDFLPGGPVGFLQVATAGGRVMGICRIEHLSAPVAMDCATEPSLGLFWKGGFFHGHYVRSPSGVWLASVACIAPSPVPISRKTSARASRNLRPT